MKTSVMTKASEEFLKIKYRRKSEAEIRRSLEKKKDRPQPAGSKPSWMPIRSEVTERTLAGSGVFTLRGGDEKRTIVYFRGGAYTGGLMAYHWRVADVLSRLCGCETVMPDYPTAPYHTWKDAFGLADMICRPLFESGRELIFMGDSAGGGLAAALYRKYLDEGYKRPEKAVLFSPWLETDMRDEATAAFARKDVYLNTDVRECARWWAGELPLTDWRISPLYADLGGFDDITVFAGGREMLFPQITAFCDRLCCMGKNCRLIVNETMGHDYPLYPSPEGRAALQTAADIINGQ